MTESPLGKTTPYLTQYDPTLLFPIARAAKRNEINANDPLPFQGYDIWNAYELSWLNEKGKPRVAIGTLTFPCDTPNLIGSKSLKLYFNSFNHTHFKTLEEVTTTVKQDLTDAAGKEVAVRIELIENLASIRTDRFAGQCLDALDIHTQTYCVNPQFLSVEEDSVTETLYTNCFSAICLATGQSDWASIKIHYTGKKLNHAGLLKYLISYRQHSEFHEQCIERIFMDILNQCQPTSLTIEARFTRRGGIDINPIRSTEKITPTNQRHIRQ